MTKQPKKLKPAKDPFELVILAGTLTLVELTSEAAILRIGDPRSPRSYQLGLPVSSLRAWITSVDEAVAAHEAMLAATKNGHPVAESGDVQITDCTLAPSAEEPA